jgi:segregation and condensation protein B
MLTLKQAIEALVFASPKPISIDEIRVALRGAAADTEDLELIAVGEAGDEEVAAQLNLLRAEYEQTGRAFQMTEQATGWALVTVGGAGEWVRQLYPETRPTRLSGPALETLAIIAYRQPVTRADIEAVRGVAVDGVMQVLLDRGLVKIAGRAEQAGRPLLYETTEYFLQHFGLRHTEELPNSDELRRVPLPKAVIPEAEPAGEIGEAAAEGEKPKKGRKKKNEGGEPPGEGATVAAVAGAAATAEAASESSEESGTSGASDGPQESNAAVPTGGAEPAEPPVPTGDSGDAAVSPDAAPPDPASDAAVAEDATPAEAPIDSTAEAVEPVADDPAADSVGPESEASAPTD